MGPVVLGMVVFLVSINNLINLNPEAPNGHPGTVLSLHHTTVLGEGHIQIIDVTLFSLLFSFFFYK